MITPEELKRYLDVMKASEVDSIQIKVIGEFELTVTGLAPIIKPERAEREQKLNEDDVGLEFLKE